MAAVGPVPERLGHDMANSCMNSESCRGSRGGPAAAWEQEAEPSRGGTGGASADQKICVAPRSRFPLILSSREQKKDVMDTLPMTMREELACAINNSLFAHVRVL